MSSVGLSHTVDFSSEVWEADRMDELFIIIDRTEHSTILPHCAGLFFIPQFLSTMPTFD